MNRVVLGAFAVLLLGAAAVFWFTGREAAEAGAPPPELAGGVLTPRVPDALPSADADDLRGPAPPQATEMTREQRRFARYDRNGDRIVSRNELMATRTAAFRKLDADGNNLLTFEEWAVTTGNRFKAADGDGNLQLTSEEFRRTAPKPAKRPECRC